MNGEDLSYRKKYLDAIKQLSKIEKENQEQKEYIKELQAGIINTANQCAQKGLCAVTLAYLI